MLCCDRKIMKRVDSTVTVEGGGLSKSKLGVCRLELAVRVHDEVVDMLHCLLACKITFANIRHAGNSNKYGNISCGISNKNNAKKIVKKIVKSITKVPFRSCSNLAQNRDSGVSY